MPRNMGLDNVHYFFSNYKPDGKKVFQHASKDGSERAENDYPYAIYRDKSSIEQLAIEALQEWLNSSAMFERSQGSWNISQTLWPQYGSEIQRLYIPAYVAGYLQTVEKKDEEAKPKPKPQPQPVPTNTITVGGATFTVKKIDRTADEVIYYLEINHPGVTNGVNVVELVTPLNQSMSLQELANEASNILKDRGELPS